VTALGIQQRYWTEVVQLKAQAYYLDAYYLDSERKDGALKIFLAITSSSSIGAWIIWRHLGFVWAAVVACSLVGNAIRQYLPWEKRAAAVRDLGREIADILLLAEKRWYAVATGQLTESEIHEATMELKRRRNDAEYRHLTGHPLPDNAGHQKDAEERTVTYFQTHYGIGGVYV
jgi:hypothetical protein